MDTAVYVIHSKLKCPERSDWATVLLSDVRKLLVDKDIKCKLSSILSTDNSSRLQLHIQALRSAANGKHLTIVFEDDTIVFQDIADIVTRFTKSNDDIWYLTSTKTVYIIRGGAATRLLKHVDNPSTVTKSHRDIIHLHAESVYLNTKMLKNVCEDGSQTGRRVPTIVADKPCVVDVPNEFTVDTTAKWWKTHPHPYTALCYAKALKNNGDIKQSGTVCEDAIKKFMKFPDCRGDTDLLTFTIELYKSNQLRIL